jgi:hypothetical protein
VSYGAKMQLIKFEYSEDAGYSQSRKYDLPQDWSEEQVAEFQRDTTIQLRAEIEPLIQADIDEMQRRRDEYKGKELG